MRRALAAAAAQLGDMKTAEKMAVNKTLDKARPLTPLGKSKDLVKSLQFLGGHAFVGTRLYYGRFVHGGTKKMKKRPFLRKGLYRARNEIKKEYLTHTVKAVRKAEGNY